MTRRHIIVTIGLCLLSALALFLAMALDYSLQMRRHARLLSDELERATRAQARMGGGGRGTSRENVFGVVFNRIEFNCRGRDVDDEKLKHLAGLTGVVGMDLSENPITHEGLRFVAEVPHLQWLQLSRTHITNKGLKHLRGLKQLRVLDLTHTQITQEAAEHLAEIRMLDAVYANGTDLRTVPGVAVDVSSEPETWIDGRTVWPFPLPQH